MINSALDSHLFKLNSAKNIFLTVLSILYFSIIGKSQVVVSGSILSPDKQRIFVVTPISGFYTIHIVDSSYELRVDSNGNFERSIPLKEPFQLGIIIGSNRIDFLGIPGDTINLRINVPKLEGNSNIVDAVEFKGKNNAGHTLFRTHCFPPIGMYQDFRKFLENSNWYGGLRRLTLFDSLLNTQTKMFDNLYLKGEVSKPYHIFVTSIIKNYLVSAVAGQVKESRNYSPEEKMEFLGAFYSKYQLPFSDPLFRNSFFSGFISGWQLDYLRALKEGNNGTALDRYVTINGHKYFLNRNLALHQYAPKQLAEGLWALSLISLKRLFGGSYNQRDVDTYKAYYPNSPFNKYLQPPVFGFFPWTKEDSLSKVKIIAIGNKDNIDSIISKHFKNENVLVDLWATWCVPCKQEFLHNPELEQYFRNYNIKRLYISLDPMTDKNVMINDIYAYHLSGTHVMMTYALQKDIIKRIYNGAENNRTIPRYFFIDSTGRIVDTNLVRPSQQKHFSKKIGHYLYGTR
ncbi:redoxin family protein [Niabella sp. CC-SYL272]|uniref:TlpA family protein disulfide reductase n=1 Tax=Niabella agricola TaxID=2891571 RepID=UPI001F32393C|nr:redoxin family protein [Niabella agricola]MCF3110624.1 redoxin family protein [Niabella agricola]